MMGQYDRKATWVFLSHIDIPLHRYHPESPQAEARAWIIIMLVELNYIFLVWSFSHPNTLAGGMQRTGDFCSYHPANPSPWLEIAQYR